MSSEIKTEFKDFVKLLTEEICKEVLLEDLKQIHGSFSDMSDNYKAISEEYKVTGIKYKENITEVKDQLKRLDVSNSKLDQFITETTDNNNKVEQALTMIHSEHKSILHTIAQDSKNVLNNYREEIKLLTERERKVFIAELVRGLNEESQSYLVQLGSLLNINRLECMLNTIEIINKKVTESAKGINDNIDLANELNRESHQITAMVKNLNLSVQGVKADTEVLIREIQSGKESITDFKGAIYEKLNNMEGKLYKAQLLTLGLLGIILILIFIIL